VNAISIPTSIRIDLLDSNQARPIERVQTGLSESIIWKCTTPNGLACLRAWATNHPNLERLAQIHQAMKELSDAGLSMTPKLFGTSRGQSFAADGGRFWELTTWLPGQADYLTKPSDAKLLASLSTLAAIHDVWARSARKASSPTLHDRRTRLADCLGKLAEIETRFPYIASSNFEQGLCSETCAALRQHGPRLAAELAQLDEGATVHCVLRDIWSDHVLFTDETVTGVIDFGALRIDEPTTDLVRLLSSLEPLNASKQELGLAAYESLRKMKIDRNRFGVLRQVAMLLAAFQWMQWLVIERREFGTSRDALLHRWQQFIFCTQVMC
jgi:Ser/Thr protein kinase RdoA (MazF antagonist)